MSWTQWSLDINQLYGRDRKGRVVGGIALSIQEGIDSHELDTVQGVNSSLESLRVEIPGQGKKKTQLGES